MPVIKINRLVYENIKDYFIITNTFTVSTPTIIELDSALFPEAGKYAVICAQNIVGISNLTFAWSSGSGPTIIDITTETRVINGTSYTCICIKI